MDRKKRRIGLFGAVFGMFVFAALACSGGDEGGDEKRDTVVLDGQVAPPDTATTDGGGTTADAGTTDAGATDGGTGSSDGGTSDTGGTDGGPQTVREGQVTVEQGQGANGARSTLSANFLISEIPEGANKPCETISEGACRATLCGDSGESSFEVVSAGRVDVTGGIEELSISPDNGVYGADTVGSDLWDGSQTLTVEASGDRVPPFSQTLQPSVGADLQSPSLPASGENLTVDTGSDLVVRWSTAGIQGGEFFVKFASTGGEEYTSVDVTCEFDATSGVESVPRSLLGEIPSGSEGSYTFGLAESASVEAGEFEVTLRAVDVSDDDQDSNEDGSGLATFE